MELKAELIWPPVRSAESADLVNRKKAIKNRQAKAKFSTTSIIKLSK